MPFQAIIPASGTGVAKLQLPSYKPAGRFTVLGVSGGNKITINERAYVLTRSGFKEARTLTSTDEVMMTLPGVTTPSGATISDRRAYFPFGFNTTILLDNSYVVQIPQTPVAAGTQSTYLFFGI